MRIVIFSDTHGNFSAMHKIMKHNGNADLFIFLGDGLTEFRRLRSHYIDSKMVAVKGNCDLDPELPDSNIYKLPDGRKIFYTHGDKWNVRFSIDKLYLKAKEEGCAFLLFGHTHCRYAEKRDNMLILNPGSAGLPRDGKPACYAWIDISYSGDIYNFVDL